jgi:hypothetical protein
MRPVMTVICARVAYAMWWYVLLVVALLPPALVMLLGKRGADAAK